MTSASNLNKGHRAQSYIKAIDGLRAVAVLAVLVFHLNPAHMPGGFIGVDVFFVISGFLITRNILSDLKAGDFSFSRFYLRRIGRLFPALFATVILTLMVAVFVISPGDLMNLGRAAIAVIFSVSNFLFLSEAGYFDTAATSKPLLHSWSLSVEEQFYVIWPLVLVSIFAFLRKQLLLVLATLGIASFIAALIVSNSHPQTVFFLMPFRIYQFCIGGMLACLALHPKTQTASGFLISGLAGIFALSFLITDESSHFMAATLPALAAGAVIYGAETSIGKKLLANGLASWLGRRSYSIYLAHWPLITLTIMGIQRPLDAAGLGILFVGSIGLGALLHSAVERPFRPSQNQPPSFRRGVLISTALSGLLAVTLASGYWAREGFVQGKPTDLRDAIVGMPEKWKIRQAALRTGVCNFPIDTQNADGFDSSVCSNPPDEGNAYLVIGDSYASDAYLIFSAAFPEVYFGQLTLPGCLLAPAARLDDQPRAHCRELYAIAFRELVNNPSYDGIILSSNWQDGHHYRIAELIKDLQRTDRELIIIGQRARFTERVPPLVSAGTSRLAVNIRATELLRPLPGTINETIIKRFGEEARIADLYSLQCSKICEVISEDNEILYLDDAHISMAGARYLADKLLATGFSLNP